jgi:hypothetical protein
MWKSLPVMICRTWILEALLATKQVRSDSVMPHRKTKHKTHKLEYSLSSLFHLYCKILLCRLFLKTAL